ncbi:hypothetical protein AB6A40_010306 [Gnathostoma spinigerum]|uniref:Uncharacterized protein n=1 Tax=Gnathostoma spinigerum TaxID=75299 RepID=A0ABD6F283_9BILA
MISLCQNLSSEASNAQHFETHLVYVKEGKTIKDTDEEDIVTGVGVFGKIGLSSLPLRQIESYVQSLNIYGNGFFLLFKKLCEHSFVSSAKFYSSQSSVVDLLNSGGIRNTLF